MYRDTKSKKKACKLIDFFFFFFLSYSSTSKPPLQIKVTFIQVHLKPDFPYRLYHSTLQEQEFRKKCPEGEDGEARSGKSGLLLGMVV